MIKILTVVGARPQFIKAAAVSKIISQTKNLDEIIVHTGQHYDKNISEVFFDQLNISKPKFIMSLKNRSHSKMTAEIMSKLEDIVLAQKPDCIMVYGDTNSTLAGALVASKALIPLAHIEAGLRSFNKNMPEEVNRILVDHVSTFLFCPSLQACNNLAQENIRNGVHLVGDVMLDVAMLYRNKIKGHKGHKKEFALCTVHRQENTDNKNNLINIFSSLIEIAKEIEVIIPLHPRTKKMLEKFNIPTHGLEILEPVGYLEMLEFLDQCKMVLTDSGGLQKEAYLFKKPLLILREETEWTELIENNCALLGGSKKESIMKAFKKLASLTFSDQNLYGNGDASAKIVEILKNSL